MAIDELAACATGAGHDAWGSDRDRDKDVDGGDIIKAFLGKMGNPAAYDARSDANGDGDNDGGDLIKLFLGRVGSRCAAFTFTNNTGGPVDDIHIEWGGPVAEVPVALDSGLAGWSMRTISGGGLVLDMERPDATGDLPNGGQLTAVIRAQGPLSVVAACRWGLDGVDQGAR